MIKITIEGWQDEPVVLEGLSSFYIVAQDKEGEYKSTACLNPLLAAVAAANAQRMYDDSLNRKLARAALLEKITKED